MIGVHFHTNPIYDVLYSINSKTPKIIISVMVDSLNFDKNLID